MERSGRPLVERVALGIAVAHVRIVDEIGAYGDRVRVRVSVPESTDLDNLRIAPGEPVRLWAEHPDEAGAVRGVYERREEQSLWLMLDRSVEEVDRDYAIDPEAPELTFDRGDKAITRAREALANSDLARVREEVAFLSEDRLFAPDIKAARRLVSSGWFRSFAVHLLPSERLTIPPADVASSSLD